MKLFPVFGVVAAAVAFTGSFKPMAEISEDSWTSSLGLRLMDRGTLAGIRYEAAWTISPSVGDPPETIPDEGYTPYRITDPEPEMVSGEDFTILHNIDRLNIQFRPWKFRVTAGRQAVYWGVSRSMSPTDFVAPFPWGTLDTEYRVGVDAVRITFPTGVMSELEAGIAFGEDAHWDKSSLWFRDRFYLLETDVTLLGAKVRENSMAGASLNRALLGASVWTEGAVTATEDHTWYSVTAGLERSFLNNDLYAYAEYLHLGGNTDEALSEGAMYLTGSSYGTAGATFLATPLLSFTAAVLTDLNTGSSQVTGEGQYSLSDNASIAAGVSCGSGSEFKDLPFTAHGRYALYFRTR